MIFLWSAGWIIVGMWIQWYRERQLRAGYLKVIGGLVERIDGPPREPRTE